MLHATSVDVNGVHRRPGTDEQTVAVFPTKTEIGDPLGRAQAAEAMAVRSNAVHAIACAAPDMALYIHADAIGVTRTHLVEQPRLAKAATTILHIENEDASFWIGIIRCPRIDHVQERFIRREGQTIGSNHLRWLGHRRQRAIVGIKTIDPGRLARTASPTLVVIDQSVERITEPDRSVPFHHHIVGGVEGSPRWESTRRTTRPLCSVRSKALSP